MDEETFLLHKASSTSINSQQVEEGREEAVSRDGSEVVSSSFTLSMQEMLSESTLGYPSAFIIMLSMSYGSAVIILPYTVQQLGIVLWLITTLVCFIFLFFGAIFLKFSCAHVLRSSSKAAKVIMIRHSYPRVAELIIGTKFSKLVQVTMYICLICQVIAFMLLSATTMNRMIPMSLTRLNRIRVWLLICYVVVIPVFMLGTYKKLVPPAIIAACTSIVATICVFTTSIAAKYRYGSETQITHQEVVSIPSYEGIFKMFGDILFAAAGPALIIPNLVVLLKKPEKFHFPIAWTHVILFCIYIVLALLPYIVFKDNTQSSIIHTLNNTVQSFNMGPFWLSLITIADVSLAIHFSMVSVLSLNPVFLSLENTFRISSAFSLKRVVFRSSVAIVLLSISLLVPVFEPIISIIGAFPLALLCIIYPIIVYWEAFDCKWWMKAILILIVIITVILMIGNVIYGIIDIVHVISK